MKTQYTLFLTIVLLLLAACGQSSQVSISTVTPTVAVIPTATRISTTPSWTVGDRGVEWAQVSFDELAPPGIDMQQCWNGMGMDDHGRIYIGFTSVRADGREDFLIFRYDPKSGEKVFLGAFLDIVAAANNAQEGESIPKGHTRMTFADGKMYMGSQSFHDLKWEIDTLPTYRGSHLFAFDVTTGLWKDLSAPLQGGVLTRHEGIVSLNIIPELHLLVGLAHPSSDIVLYDYQNEQLVDVIRGIPWKLGNPLSREVIVTPTGRIYTYRGTEDPKQHEETHHVWVYDIQKGEMRDTGFAISNGFWIGQTQTRDGSKIYVSTTNGELYEFDVTTETFRDLGYMLPQDQIDAGRQILYTYAITLSPDEMKIYMALSVLDHPEGSGELYAYDIASGDITFIQQLLPGIYTSADLRDDHNIYFSHFGGYSNLWSGDAHLFILHVPPMP